MSCCYQERGADENNPSERQQQEDHDHDDDATLLLECGTSLAEIEHYHHRHDDETVVKRDSDQPSSSSSSEKKNGQGIDSIASLRERLASDVVVTDGRGGNETYTMVSSPLFRCGSSSSSGNSSSGKFRQQIPLVYCDHTASNRPIKSIERYMEQVCLPLYGNTHTNTCITGSQR